MTGLVIGRYPVKRRLGEGGMGEVFLAEDPELERLVAVKVLSPRAAADPDAQARFQREAKTLAALNHPGIVTIYEIGHDGDQRFITMELVTGRTLREELARGEIKLDRLLEIAISVAEAIAAAHDAGVLHRDIKPENVMVLGNGGVKVVDFGVARRVEGERPERGSGDLLAALAQTMPIGQAEADTVTADTNTIFGTPGYMAPEILCGDGSSAKSDVYSFGVLLYEAVTGKLPFFATSLLELLGKIMDPRERPPRLDAGDGDRQPVPAALAELIDEMMARDPDKRPTMTKARDRLQAILAARETADLAPLAAEAGFSAPTVPVTRAGKRRLYAIIGGAAVVATVAVGAAFALGRGDDTAKASRSPAAVAAETPKPGSIGVAVAPVAVSGIPGLTGDSYAIAQLFVSALQGEPAFKVIGADSLYFKKGDAIDDPATLRAAARECHAAYLALISLTGEQGGAKITGTVTVIGLASGEKLAQKSASARDLGTLVPLLARPAMRTLVPASKVEIPRRQQSMKSLAAFQRGMEALFTSRWPDAVTAFTQAADAQPSSFEAWYHLALASAWSGVSQMQTLEAAKKAEALATTARDKTLLAALEQYVQRNFSKAAAILEPLAKERENDRELLYLYAEALYHDGRFEAGIEQFDQVLRIAPEFSLAAHHPLHSAMARRDEKAAQFYARIAKLNEEGAWRKRLAVALGDYPLLLMDDHPYYRYVGLTLLGRLDKAGVALAKLRTKQPRSHLAEGIARAIFAGRPKAARAAFTSVWKPITEAWKVMPDSYYMQVAPIGGVLIIGEMRPELKMFVEGLERAGPMFRATRETMAVHAAAVLERPDLLPDAPQTYRLRTAKEAVAAELRGDHATAIKKWESLAADPGPQGDYLVRAALARNLFALGRTGELAKLCRDQARPAVYRAGHLAFVRRCLDWGALESYPLKR